MKITHQLLADISKCSLTNIQYLDLSYLNIASIQNLDSCINLKVLSLKGNQIDCLYGLEKCKQLWKLDVSNNKIKSLDGLEKFVALGSLNLSNNDLNWSELDKIRHLHIIELNIFGNIKLEKDPHYRTHISDCLPSVWILDGLLVTSNEKLEIEYFFEQSALSPKPVRRKLPKDQFIPTDLKNKDIFGDWSTRLLSMFPVNSAQNVETDKRKIEFISEWFQYLISCECKEVEKRNNKLSLKELLDYRKANTEACNMILVLLVASLEFSIPVKFMQDALEFIHLKKIGCEFQFDTMDLFLLPKTFRLYAAVLLLSGAKLDLDQNVDSGFYDHLFQSLHIILEEIIRLSNSTKSNYVPNTLSLNYSLVKDSRALLTTEIMQLFAIMPSFYEHISLSEGLMTILSISFNDERIFDTVQGMIFDLKYQNKSLVEICQEMGPFVANMLKANMRILLSKKTRSKKVKYGILNRRFSSLKVHTTEDSINSYKRPCIGDTLLIGPQITGHIVTLPETDICQVQCDHVLTLNGSMENSDPSDHYLYVNLKYFEWDDSKRFWRPKGSFGDRITFHYGNDLFDKTLIWPRTSSANHEEIKHDSLNNEVQNSQFLHSFEDKLEINLDKLQDNMSAISSTSARSKSSTIKNDGKNNTQKITKLELDVNGSNQIFTPRTNPLINTTKRTIQRKQKDSDKEKENTQKFAKSEFMKRSNSSKLLSKGNKTDDESVSITDVTMLQLRTNRKSPAYNRENSNYSYTSGYTKYSTDNEEFTPVSTADPDYQTYDANSTLLDNSKETSKKVRGILLINHKKHQPANSRPSSPTGLAFASTEGTQSFKNKKSIKIQDCSLWFDNVHLSNMNMLNVNQFNRMSIVMNWKSSRINTKPKIPILTSPSSVAHETFRGLRPSTGRESANLVLNSRKLQVK